MKPIASLIALVSVALAGCATAGSEGSAPIVRGDGQCNADAAQRLIGSKATGEVGAELLRLTGTTSLRWVPPRTAVTMDFRADRLTVSYDDELTIERISCT
jgi:hypothetical protein